MMRMVFLRATLIGGVLLAGLIAPAQGQDYPTRPVTFVVPYTPGGATDLFARLLGQKLEQRLGKPFIIENKPGASAVNLLSRYPKIPPACWNAATFFPTKSLKRACYRA